LAFDPVSYSTEELVPLIRALISLAEQEGEMGQSRFFTSILGGLENATEGEDLADPFMQLTMSAFSGFAFSPAVGMLLDQLLAKAQRLSEVLSLDSSEIN
jgi:hypothetical protein